MNHDIIQYALIGGAMIISFIAVCLSGRDVREIEVAKKVVKLIKELTLNYPKD